MRGRAHALVQGFFEKFASSGHAFIRARFILKTQMEPEQIGPELDDPALEARVAEAIEELSGEIERMKAASATRGASSTTLKPLKRPT